LSLASPARAEPVAVRYVEGAAHGFLVLYDGRGRPLAEGDWWQIPKGDRVEITRRFRFHDGSISQETMLVGQRGVFTLDAYTLIQRGPAFPKQIEATIDRETRRYTVKLRDRPGAPETTDDGDIDLPEDVYGTGMLAVLLRNLGRDEGFTARAVIFLPKPRLVTLKVSAAGDEKFRLGADVRTARRYIAHPELGGVLGAAAGVGKTPPDLHYWMAGDPVATLVRFEGPLYPNGPVWRIDFVGPRFAR
jgi:hypothetical protein